MITKTRDRPAWRWRAGTHERIQALDALSAALDAWRNAPDRSDHLTSGVDRTDAAEGVWLALIDVLDLAADDLRARRAAR